MKKFISNMLAALLLLGGFTAPMALAQNAKSYEAFSSQGAPGINLNAVGTYWGQVSNLSQGVWGFSYAPSAIGGLFGQPTTNGTPVASWGPLVPTATSNAGALFTVDNLFNNPSSVIFNVQTTTTIPVNSSYQVLVSSGGNETFTSTPTIATTTASGAAIPDGTFMVLTTTTTATFTLQSNGTLSGSDVKLGASTRAITQYKGLLLQFNQALGMWLEISYFSDAN